jgi:AraC-like DNA-binding protein
MPGNPTSDPIVGPAEDPLGSPTEDPIEDPTEDPIERAHLLDRDGFTPPIGRLDPAADLASLIRRFWVPVWSLEPGRRTVQRVLQYPVCQLVIAPDYAHLVGPRVGMSTKELSGTGWAFGAMLQAAAGAMLLGGPMTGLVDRDLDLVDVPGLDAVPLIAAVRETLAERPTDPERQRCAATLVEGALRPLLPIGEEAGLANALVDLVESDPAPTRVADLAEGMAMSERSLQRLAARRIGLSPKWLIQRRRLHDAAGRLRRPDRPPLSRLAAELGYADEAHFVRDFRRVTGLTPGAFSAEPRASVPTG